MAGHLSDKSTGKSVAAEWVDPKSLVKWERNVKHHTKAAVQKTMEAIQRFGFTAPIVARRANRMVIAGHRRLEAALRLQLAEVPVRFMDVSQEDAEKIAILDNRSAKDTKESADDLASVLGEWAEAGMDLTEVGFDYAEIDKLLDASKADEIEEIDVSSIESRFFMSISGPLPKQVDVIDLLKKSLSGIEGIDVAVSVT